MATARLNDRDLLKLSPGDEAQLVVRDSEVHGFICKVGRTARTFAVDYRAGGKRYLVTIGRLGEVRSDGLKWSAVLARERARELLGEVRDGGNPAAPVVVNAGRTLRDGLELHIRNMRKDLCSEVSIEILESEVKRYLGPASPDAAEARAKAGRPAQIDFLDLPITELTTAALGEVHDRIMLEAKRRAGGNPSNPPGSAVANRVRRHVSAIWTSLDQVAEVPARNPARGVRPQKEKARESRIDDDAFKAWHDAVETITNPIRRDFQILALFTGVRAGGLVAVRHEDYDAESATLWIARAKGDKPYLVPLSQTAVDVIERRLADNPLAMAEYGGDHGWIFPSFTARKPYRVIHIAEPNEKIYSAGKRIRDPRLPPIHDLRRTFNSVGKEAGVPREAREMLLNHAGQGVNERHYTKPQNWDYFASCSRAIEAALWERIKGERKARKLRAPLALPAARP